MAKKTRSENNWDNLLVSLAAARSPQHRDSTGLIDLTNAIVFAARVGTDFPKWVAAQTAASELVEQIGGFTSRITRKDVAEMVDYIVEIAPLPELPMLEEAA